ncbi:MAG: Biosynthetic Aromatic amino acid aminotransferase beta [uncultured Chthoniobacterales bacterium]|uniref:Histidinol-phosphate aminotransferase n=1 Tax=uncultured Chthoniobacterales bacterium TaxID=1836801 RepID=A0A6J4HSB4_9BACT|nr:MAG: Biosynthetic Aromatic amino acid aminotransferase beta [uncultured Chthoniobacterales bacterium]
MTSIWDSANPQLRDLAVYQPGKPIEETAREFGTRASDIIKLASNENPLGPSPKALQAMHAAVECTHLYPDGGGYYVTRALSEKLGVPADHIILGNGSNEVIEFIGHAFLRPGAEIITPEHAFIAYKIIAKVFGARTTEIPSPDFRQDLDAIANAITPDTRVIFIANPNNPTGTMAGEEEIERFMSRVREDVVVVFDEAYYEYVDRPPDTLKFVRDGRNVVVLRTFSKIHGLASARLGYGIARPELISVLQKTREPFNANGIAQAAAAAAITDEAHQRETKRITDEGRAYLQEQFAAMGLRFVPSFGNFVLVHVADGASVFKALLPKGVIVRAMSGYNLAEWVRVSVGTMPQNERCIAALKEVLSGAKT